MLILLKIALKYTLIIKLKYIYNTAPIRSRSSVLLKVKKRKMTDHQFEILVSHLKELKESIDSLKGSPDAKNKYDLSDIYSELCSVTSAVSDVESAVSK